MFEFYLFYITSKAWLLSAARQAELRSSCNQCRICNAGPQQARITVHHRTYERLGCERASDLTTLCSERHDVVTDMLRRRRNIQLPKLVDMPLAVPRVLRDSTWGDA